MKIGELARKAGVTSQTIRYYDRLGLLTASRKSKRGFRQFTNHDLDKIKIIKGLQALQMPLDRIITLFRIWSGSPTGRDASRDLTQALQGHLESIEARTSDYEELRSLFLAALNEAGQCQQCEKRPIPEVCGQCTVLPCDDRKELALAAFF